MVTENTQEAGQWQTGQATETTTEVADTKVITPQPERTFTQADIDAAKQQALKEAKLELRRDITKNTQRVKDLEGKARVNEHMATEIHNLRELVQAQILDAQSQATGQAPQTNVERVLAKLSPGPVSKEPEPQTDPMVQRAWEKIVEIADGQNLKDVKFAKAAEIFNQGDYFEAIDEVRRVVAEPKKEPEKVETPKPKTPQERVEEIKQAGQANPRPSVGTGATPSLMGMTPKEFYERSMKDDGIKWMKEHEKEIGQLHEKWQQGRK